MDHCSDHACDADDRPAEPPMAAESAYMAEPMDSSVPAAEVPMAQEVHQEPVAESMEELEVRPGMDRFGGRGRGRVMGRMPQRPTLSPSRAETSTASSQQPAVRRTTNPSNPSIPIPNASVAPMAGGRRPQRGRVPVSHVGRVSGQFHAEFEEHPAAVSIESPIAAAVSEVESPEDFRSDGQLHQIGAMEHIAPDGLTPNPSLVGETVDPSMVGETLSPDIVSQGEEPCCVGNRQDGFKVSSAYLNPVNPDASAAEIEVSEYKARLSSAQLEVQKLSVACEDAIAVRDKLEEEKSTLLQRLDDAENALTETEDKLHQAQDELIELRDAFDMAIQDRDKAEGELDILRQEMEQLRHDQSSHGAELESLRATASNSESAIREARQVAEELRDELIQTQAALEAAEQKNNQFVDEKNALLARIETAEQEKAACVAVLDAKDAALDAAQHSLDEVSAQRDEGFAQRDQLNEELEASKRELEELRLKLNEATSTPSVNIEEFEAQKAELDGAYAQIEQIKQENGALHGDMDALQSEVDALHGQMEMLVSDRDAATNESESLRAQLLDLQDQNVAAQNQIQLLQEDVGRLSAEKNDSVSVLNEQLAQLQAENASLQNQMANATDASADAGELETLRNELQKLRESSETEINQLRARVEKSIRQRDEVKMAFEEAAQQNEMLHKQLASAQAGGGSSACSDFVRKWTPRFASIIEFAQEMTNSIDATQGLDPSVSENAHEMLNVLVKVNQKMNKANETLG